MSGIKDLQVQITQAELNRLHNNVRAAEESIRQSQQRERQSQNALNVANSKVNELNNTLKNENSKLHADMRSIANKQNERLKKQSDEYNKRFNEQAATYKKQLNKQAAEQNARFEKQSAEQNARFKSQADSFNRSIGDVKNQMENQRVQLQSSIDDVRQQGEANKRELQSAIRDVKTGMEIQREVLQNSINEVRQQGEANKKELQNAIKAIDDKINVKEENHKKIAEFWIEQTQAYFTDIEQYRHNMFTPGQLDKLKSQLDMMRSDMSTGAYQSAISSARAVFGNAVELKEDIVNAEMEWNYYHSIFQQALAETDSNLDYYKSMQFEFKTENSNEFVDANIDYWTENALSEIGTALSKIKQKTESIEQASKDELIKLTDSIAQLNSRMDSAAYRAREALISSQIRAEMADNLAQALYEQGWECDGVTYVRDEQNEPVHIKLSDGMGNEIVTVITPDKNSAGMANQVEINFFDHQSNDENLRQIWISSIQNGLKESNLHVGNPVCRKGFESNASNNNAIRDIQATARK